MKQSIKIIEIQHNYIIWADTGSKHFLPESSERQKKRGVASQCGFCIIHTSRNNPGKTSCIHQNKGMCSFKVLPIWIQWNTLKCLQCSSLVNSGKTPPISIILFFLFIYFNLSIFSVTIVLFRVVSFDINIIGLKYYTFSKIQRVAVNSCVSLA